MRNDDVEAFRSITFREKNKKHPTELTLLNPNDGTVKLIMETDYSDGDPDDEEHNPAVPAMWLQPEQLLEAMLDIGVLPDAWIVQRAALISGVRASSGALQ